MLRRAHIIFIILMVSCLSFSARSFAQATDPRAEKFTPTDTAGSATGWMSGWSAMSQYGLGDEGTVTQSGKLVDCVGVRGNVQLLGECDPSDQTVDITDLTNLIDHLFGSYAPLCSEAEADLVDDHSATVDISDVTALTNHLFTGYPPLPTCP